MHTTNTKNGKNYFISGGCRSGKSSLALRYGQALGTTGLFIATATPCDDEMQQRIAKHQQERSNFWQLHEMEFGQGLQLAANLPTICKSISPQGVVLLDCLTLWVSSCMEQMRDADTLQAKAKQLVQALYALPQSIIIVSNEVGLGLVPPTATGRLFRDFVGFANQCAATHADNAIFCVSGLPLLVKGNVPCTL